MLIKTSTYPLGPASKLADDTVVQRFLPMVGLLTPINTSY